MLHRDGRFRHEGVLVTHRRLHEVLLRGVAWLAQEGVFVVRVGPFRGQIEVEDTPFFVATYEPTTGEIDLSDRTRERLRPETVALDDDGVLRCRLHSGFPARFTRTAQAQLLLSVEPAGDGFALRAGAGLIALPGLAGCA